MRARGTFREQFHWASTRKAACVLAALLIAMAWGPRSHAQTTTSRLVYTLEYQLQSNDCHARASSAEAAVEYLQECAFVTCPCPGSIMLSVYSDPGVVGQQWGMLAAGTYSPCMGTTNPVYRGDIISAPVQYFASAVAQPNCQCTKDPQVDPANPAIGNIHTTETDVQFSGAGAVAFRRFYNSADSTGADGVPEWFPATVPLEAVVEYDVIRDDGQIFRFSSINGAVSSLPGVSVRLAVTGSGFTVTDDQDTVETYNAAGVLQSITSRAGVMQTIAYDANGLFQAATHSFGNSISVARNARPSPTRHSHGWMSSSSGPARKIANPRIWSA
jgi:YD repeat-containing protein